MKFLIGMVVLALGIYWGAKQGYIGGQWIGRIFSLGPSAGDSALDQVVKNTNAKLPRMITSDISFDRVTANKQEVIFHYRFVNLDQMGALQRYGADLPGLQRSIVEDVCGNGEIRQYVFGAGHAAQVMLRSLDMKPIVNTYVRAERCR
jgi:hypothetical protein